SRLRLVAIAPAIPSPRRARILLVIRRLLTSPLLPYTTLFRSDLFSGKDVQKCGFTGPISCNKCGLFAFFKSEGKGVEQTYITPVDRKSTRLNSSHVKISYAVFCLQKKKQKKTRASAKRAM